jgi:hypothetical protein
VIHEEDEATYPCDLGEARKHGLELFAADCHETQIC